MQILGKYLKDHAKPMRVTVNFLKIRDRLLIGGTGYFIIEARRTPCPTILLDRPLERATNFHEAIAYEVTPDVPPMGEPA